MIKQEVYKQKMTGLALAVKELIDEAKELSAAAASEDGEMDGEDPANAEDVAAKIGDTVDSLVKAKAGFESAE